MLLAVAAAPAVEAATHHGFDCHVRTPRHCDSCRLSAPAPAAPTAPAITAPGPAFDERAAARVLRTGPPIEPDSPGRAPPLTAPV